MAVPRSRLEQKMLAARITQREFVDEFPAQARRIGVAAYTISARQLKRWVRGDAALPLPTTCRILEAWWGEPIERLLGPPDEIAVTAVGGDVVEEAGRRSVEHAIEAASSLDPSAIEHLHAAAARAARAYLSTAPLQLLPELVELRDTIYALLDRTAKPRQQAELYLLAGEACGLLSSVSFDLGHPATAEEQARAAHTYGSIIDHPSLCAWARALQVTVAFWSGSPRRAVGITEAALQTAPAGTARVRLHAIRARALGMIGARDEVPAELGLAVDHLERAGGDTLLDEVGGEMAFGRERLALCGSTAYIALGDYEHAEPAAAAALEAFAGADQSRRWSSGAVSASVDLATARALRGDLAGTEDALRQVLALPPAERTEAVSQRLHGLGRILGAPRYRGAVEASRIGEQVETWIAASLPRTTARPAIESG